MSDYGHKSEGISARRTLTRCADSAYDLRMTTVMMTRPRGDLRRFVAAEIRGAMSRQEVTGVRLATIIGKSQPYISRRLSGKVAFDVDDLEVIGRVLGMTPSEIIGDATRRMDQAITRANAGRKDQVAADGRLHTVPGRNPVLYSVEPGARRHVDTAVTQPVAA